MKQLKNLLIVDFSTINTYYTRINIKVKKTQYFEVKFLFL